MTRLESAGAAHALLLPLPRAGAAVQRDQLRLRPDVGTGVRPLQRHRHRRSYTKVAMRSSALGRRRRAGAPINSYHASNGTTTATTRTRQLHRRCSPTDNAYGIRDVTDGTSNTIAFSEALVGRGQADRYAETSRQWRHGGVRPPTSEHSTMPTSSPRRHGAPPDLPDQVPGDHGGHQQRTAAITGPGARRARRCSTRSCRRTRTQYQWSQCRSGLRAVAVTPTATDHSDITTPPATTPAGATSRSATGA